MFRSLFQVTDYTLSFLYSTGLETISFGALKPPTFIPGSVLLKAWWIQIYNLYIIYNIYNYNLYINLDIYNYNLCIIYNIYNYGTKSSQFVGNSLNQLNLT